MQKGKEKIFTVTHKEPHREGPDFQNLISAVGLETARLLYTLECIELEIKEGSQIYSKPHAIWQLVKRFFTVLSTKDPNVVHYRIAREALKDEKIRLSQQLIQESDKEYDEIISLVARKLSEHCSQFGAYLHVPELFDSVSGYIEQFEEIKTNLQSSALFITFCNPDIDKHFIDKNMFIGDSTFLDYISKIGKTGENIASELKQTLKQGHKEEKTLHFWFNIKATSECPLYVSQSLIILAKTIWHDEVMQKASLIKKVPAIIKDDQEHIISIMSKKLAIPTSDEERFKLIEEGKPMQIYTQGILLGEMPIPTIPTDILNTTLKGLSKLKSVEAHKTLRYLPRTAFHQAISGESDYRVIRRESFRDIAAELNIKGGKGIHNMIEILHAMAYFDFKRPNFSGNLIVLKRFQSTRTYRMDGVEITVGTSLLPYRAREDFKNGGSNLMIPILSDPLVVSSNQYHAGQYLLQMLIMGEFVEQSVDFAKYGQITILQSKWQQMAQECNVLPILPMIIDRWTQDGDDGPKFLHKLEKGFYTLGPSYEKEIDFLIRQGNHRIKQSSRGKAAALKRIKNG